MHECFSLLVEQLAHRAVGVHALNGARQKRSNREHANLAGLAIERHGDGVSHDDFLNAGILDAIICRAAEQAVRRARVHLLGALGHKGFGRRDQRPARVNHVVVQDADLAGNVADKRGDFSLVVLRAIFVR